MSFSKSFGGAKLAMLAAIAAFPAEQRAIDEKRSSTGVTVGHARQIEAAITAIKPVIEQAPDDTQYVEAAIWSHAGDGTFGYRVQISSLSTPPNQDGVAGG
jgi:hypothetical protein